MTLVAQGEKFRVFEHRVFGINASPFRYFILEDSSNSTRSQGVDYNVKLTNYYWQTKSQMKLLVKDMFNDDLAPGVWK